MGGNQTGLDPYRQLKQQQVAANPIGTETLIATVVSSRLELGSFIYRIRIETVTSGGACVRPDSIPITSSTSDEIVFLPALAGHDYACPG